MKQENYSNTGIIILIIFVFCKYGFNYGINFVKSIFNTTLELLKNLEIITFQLTGNTILNTLFGGTITFFIVGLLLEAFNIPRGKKGSYIGKIMYWIIGYQISFILNLIFIS